MRGKNSSVSALIPYESDPVACGTKTADYKATTTCVGIDPSTLIVLDPTFASGFMTATVNAPSVPLT